MSVSRLVSERLVSERAAVASEPRTDAEVFWLQVWPVITQLLLPLAVGLILLGLIILAFCIW